MSDGGGEDDNGNTEGGGTAGGAGGSGGGGAKCLAETDGICSSDIKNAFPKAFENGDDEEDKDKEH